MTDSNPTPKQTLDKMNWKPGDVEWTKTTAPLAKRKSAAQRLADRIRRSGDGDRG